MEVTMRMWMCLILILPGCAAHRLRCDQRLEPINPPAIEAPRSTP